MKKNTIIKLFSTLAFSAILIGCDNQPKFTIEGQIEDAKGQTIYLEKRGITGTNLLDSAKIKDDGSFKIKSEAPTYPELYILKLGKESINFAVDSTETIEIKSQTTNFGSNYSISGSESSARIKETVEAYTQLYKSYRNFQELHKTGKISDDNYIHQVDSALDVYKKGVSKIITTDLKSPSAYFALFQKIDNILLLDPYNKEDGRLYPAVATAWDTFHKDSERSKHLYDLTMQILKEKKLAQQENNQNLHPILADAKEVSLFNIELPGKSGEKISLADLKGKVVLLDFTSYQAPFSPAYNIQLNEAYQQYKGQFEIYQVALDSDIHLWKNTASNLPWICVRDSKGTASPLISTYNLGGLPTAFLINKNGDLVKRLTSIEDLKSEIQKLL